MPDAVDTFRVIGRWTAIVARSSVLPDPQPVLQPVSAIAEFTPIAHGHPLPVIRSELDGCHYALTKYLARLENGVLKDIPARVLDDEIPVELPGDPADPRRYGYLLPANTAALGPLPSLDYRVEFSRVVYGRANRKLLSFVFTAPTEADVTVDLAAVDYHTKIK